MQKTEKKFISNNRFLLNEWDYERNESLGLSPDTMAQKSNKLVWWHCKLNHIWQDTAANRTSGRNCPYCSGHRVWVGFNDLATTHPELCLEWDYSANGDKKPTEFSKGSRFKVWWKCSNGHSFQASIANRTELNRGCPYCAGRCAIAGENDLNSTNPALSEEWNFELNKPLTPNDVLPNSNKKVWWIGRCGHVWQDTVQSRNKGNGCPICKKAYLAKHKSLEAQNPNIAHQWHKTKNGSLSPSDVSPNSIREVWWICEKGHEFKAKIAERNKKGNCPICNSELKTSFPEQAIFYYVSKVFPEAVNRYNADGNELDVFIPCLNLGVEYDGMLYHTKETGLKEAKKDAFFCAHDIRVIRVKEYAGDVAPKDTESVIWHRVSATYQYLDDAINRLFLLVPGMQQVEVNTRADDGSISAMYLTKERENSFASHFPLLLKEWDYDKNGYLKPEYVSSKSNKPRWWICKNGHSFLTSPNKRTTRGDGCPYCSGRYATVDNNLMLANPELCIEWDYERNENKLPEKFTPVSGQKVWWICKVCDHRWNTSIANRTKGNGCPECARNKRVANFSGTIILKNGSFGSCFPKMLDYWDFDKNKVDPFNVPRFSKIEVWWKCKNCGAEWLASVHSIASGHVCPTCARVKRSQLHARPVNQFTLQGEFIKTFPSMTEAANETKAKSISACCKFKCKSSGGFIWRFADNKDKG